jgi:hypothetical protein
MRAPKGVVVLELTAGLLIAAALGLMVYCLVETIEAPRSRIRFLPVWGWQLALLVPFTGAFAWLVFGRPRAGHRMGTSGPDSTRRRPVRWDGPAQVDITHQERFPGDWPIWPVDQEPRPRGPEDDPDFIAALARRVEQLRPEQLRPEQLRPDGGGSHPDDGDETH